MRRLLALLALSLVTLAGCGGGGGGNDLTVSAATSLKDAFETYTERSGDARVRFSFGGSDELAAQIRQGAKPDVFAAANTELPEQLHAAGLVERPVTFAGNRLVLAVPADSSAVESLEDLERPTTNLVVGAPSVPVGNYTLKALGRLPESRMTRILANVRSEEPNVGSLVAKLLQSAANAAFVYATDVRGAKGRLKAIELPRKLRQRVAYGAAVVRKSDRPAEARQFIAGLLDGSGREALARAGFEPPPSTP